MKIFKINQMRNIGAIAIVVVIIGVAYVANPAFLKTTKVEAVSSGSVSGYAWSETIGWIDFAPVGGGVSVDASGNFSGYAWSENIGWINFAPTSGYPSLPNHGARLEASNTVTGWARACAGTVNGDCTGASRTDGWDGWIKLSKYTGDTGADYGVTVTPSTGNFSSYAWGSDVVGWIDFAPAVAGSNIVHMPPAPVLCSDPTAVWSPCSSSDTCVTPPDGPTKTVTGAQFCIDINGTTPRSCSTDISCTAAPASVCGNGTCEAAGVPPETILTCPSDCKTKYQQF